MLPSPLLAPKSYSRCKLKLGGQDEYGKSASLPLCLSTSVHVLWPRDAPPRRTAVVAVAGRRRACNAMLRAGACPSDSDGCAGSDSEKTRGRGGAGEEARVDRGPGARAGSGAS